MKYGLSMLVLVGVLALAGCGGGEKAKTDKPSDSPKPSAAAALPAGLLVKEAPAGAKSVAEAKKDAKEGDEIVVRGRIGGSRPGGFTEGRAQITIIDAVLPICSERPNDTCPWPWDYCCESKEDITKNAATVQVFGPDGKVLPADLKGQNGMDNTTFVVVKGKVGKRDGGNLLVNASAIYVEPKK
jgi:hypothetical protein